MTKPLWTQGFNAELQRAASISLKEVVKVTSFPLCFVLFLSALIIGTFFTYLFMRQKIMQKEYELSLSALELKKERELSQTKLAALVNTKDEFAKEFENLANRIFDEKGTRFATQNKEQLEFLLNPFKEQLKEFHKKVDDAYSFEAKERMLLSKEITDLKNLNLKISQDAINLTNALKGEQKTQGNWGELILERILESSGLREGVEFERQVHYKSEDGSVFRPDIIVHLPESRKIVIDSKVSLVGYERYVNANDDTQRESALKEHLLSVKTHIKGLSSKNYEELGGVKALDFILLFMPIEGAFLCALENEPRLFEEAFSKSIMLVSPSTLLATLKTIHNIWRYEHQNKNAEEIARQAGEMYHKFVGFVEESQKVTEQIKRALETQESAHKKLTIEKGNLVSRAQKLLELGVKSKRKLQIHQEEEKSEQD